MAASKTTKKTTVKAKAKAALKTRKRSADKPLIQAQKVRADYGTKTVLTGIDFDVKQGETFGLIGLNGAGKTTFIKILLGLMEPAAGKIRIDGKVATDPAVKEKLVYLPEKFEPPAFLSGMEFIDFALTLYGRHIPESEIVAAADRLAFQREFLNKRTTTYSKGMRQKIGLLGTLLTDSPIVILDEPTSGLDPLARARVKDEILKCRAKGMTVFLSSHILADMDEICDRVAVIDEGRLKFIGTPKKLKSDTKEDYLERAFLKIIGKAGTSVKSRRKVA